MRRQSDNRETWLRLLNWDKGQTPSERLGAQILLSQKYDSVDPSHPLGGQDGLKDIICKRDNLKFIAACYFPRGQQSIADIKKKFSEDLTGVRKNNADGIVFITNQELRLSERDQLQELIEPEHHLDLFHLERINTILNSPQNYGTRLEFLDIEMTKEEQLAYMSSNDQLIHDLTNSIKQLINRESFSDNQLLTVEKKNEPTPISVIADQIVMRIGEGVPVHKCSHCGYGFRILGTAMPTYRSVYSGRTTLYHIVTCPKCGSVDKI